MIIAEGERVRAMCEKCRGYRDVDLQALAEALGADYDLWNRTTKPCRITPGCDGRNRFYFSGRGRFSPMRDG
ncbi:MAG TPA: hypothetical protein VNS34_21625 [Rhizobiaceae bacterium]|nr:hypothetical protein [Rhizobiaceae bacterium]